jgi:DNA-binding response OmpR family regulator
MGQAASKSLGFTDRREAPAMKRVLLAEDSREIRELLTRALELDGYEVIGFPDGTSLVDYLGDVMHEHTDTAVPDIIVSDIRMPGFSGIDVLSALRRAELQVPVILITAFGNDEIAAEARRLGASLFNKPFDIDDLRTALRYFLDHGRDESPPRVGSTGRTSRNPPPGLKH